VCRLRKALYGLKQAPRAWYHTLDATLAKHGFTACMSDAGIYVSNTPGEDPVYLVLFVDDMLIMSKALVVGYALWVDKFIGNVKKCGQRERESEREHVSQ
jgi:hypothetical protein